MEPEPVTELEPLSVVWSVRESTFAEALTVARSCATAHSHPLPPTTAVWDGFPIGTWTKNQQVAARRTL